MKQRIHLSLARMSGCEQQFIQEAFDTNWVVPLGPNVNAFEKDLETFIDRADISLPSHPVQQPFIWDFCNWE